MATSKDNRNANPIVHLAMKTPPIVSQQEWETARQQLLVKEKAFTCSRDALAAERRRMPWTAVEKNYEFEGPNGCHSYRGIPPADCGLWPRDPWI